MEPVDVKSNIDFSVEKNDEDPKFRVGDHVRISKYKNICKKGYAPNWGEQASVIKRVRNTVPWTYAIEDLNGGEIVATFYGIELQETNQTDIKVEQIIKRNSNKLYVKWQRYDNSFNCWIDEKDIVI